MGNIVLAVSGLPIQFSNYLASVSLISLTDVGVISLREFVVEGIIFSRLYILVGASASFFRLFFF